MARPLSLLKSLWKHRVALGISLGITFVALFIYRYTFLGERPTPAFQFARRLELATLDLRFQFRYRLQTEWFHQETPHDTRIVIVDIDQASQEVLGRWPFPRSNFARLLDVLREDGASVVVFDVTFSKPDEATQPILELRKRLAERKMQGLTADPRLEAELNRLEVEYDHDRRFAEAIEKFGKVVLGNFFLYKQADFVGMDKSALDAYAQQIEFFPFENQIARDAEGKTVPFSTVVERFDDALLKPRGAQANIEALSNAVMHPFSGTGFFNVTPDPDGVVRRAELALPFGSDPDTNNWSLYPSIDAEGVRLYLGLLKKDVEVLYNRDTGIFRIGFGKNIAVRSNTMDGWGRMMINYHGPVRTYQYVSMGRVVKRKFAPGTFKDKLVLVGASATGIGDLRTTPFGGLDYPGVEIHANVMDNILNQNFLLWGAEQNRVNWWLIFLFGIPLGFFLAFATPRWMSLGLVLLILFAAGVQYAFHHGWWLNFVVPAGTLLANTVSVSLYRVLWEEKEKRKIRGAFQQYLSPEVIRRLLVNPELVQPRKTEITVMFSDIRGFTTISEKLDAQELALMLNDYLTDMTRLVFKHRGTLDKYIGDAVMAFWGAPFENPQHAREACLAALEMMERVSELQMEWTAEGKPELDIGLGLNTGIASVGNMGSALRYGYTAMGDNVNLASRLEGLNKEYRTHVLVSETTYLESKDAGFLFRELDLIQVKGKLQPITLYELMAGSDADANLRELVQQFAQARALYQQRKWREAQEAFAKILERWPNDGPRAPSGNAARNTCLKSHRPPGTASTS